MGEQLFLINCDHKILAANPRSAVMAVRCAANDIMHECAQGLDQMRSRLVANGTRTRSTDPLWNACKQVSYATDFITEAYNPLTVRGSLRCAVRKAIISLSDGSARNQSAGDFSFERWQQSRRRTTTKVLTQKKATKEVQKRATKEPQKKATKEVQKGATKEPQKKATKEVQKGARTGLQKGARTGLQKGARTEPQKGARTGLQKGARTELHKGARKGLQKGARKAPSKKKKRLTSRQTKPSSTRKRSSKHRKRSASTRR